MRLTIVGDEVFHQKQVGAVYNACQYHAFPYLHLAEDSEECGILLAQCSSLAELYH